VRLHVGDPAIKVSFIMTAQTPLHLLLQNFVSKLKLHLLRRITMASEDANSIIIKDDRMYHHNTARFNYTTYDVRRAQDVINPRTSHCNVMVLRAENDVEPQGHRFIYGKVLGIYHTNVIFIGVGMVDYTPIRMEFLWVRWYEPIDQVSSWDTSTMDRVKFPSMFDEHSFDFLDPTNVLRGCHIIPSFAHKKRRPDGSGISACAGDKDDWRAYYINRLAMLPLHA
jgi:hypothetical protein